MTVLMFFVAFVIIRRCVRTRAFHFAGIQFFHLISSFLLVPDAVTVGRLPDTVRVGQKFVSRFVFSHSGFTVNARNSPSS